MATTDDGGATWSAIPMPKPMSTQEWTETGIFFADAHRGWFFSRQRSTATFALFSTQDGGQSWQEEFPRGAVARISRAANGLVWALEREDAPPQWRILIVTGPSYDTWDDAPFQLPDDLPGLADIIIEDELKAWFSQWMDASGGQEPDQVAYTVSSTSDGGRHWEKIPTPCGPFLRGTQFAASLIGVGQSHLWLGCGQAAGAGSGSKFVFFSTDGGRSWQARGETSLSEDLEGSFSLGGGYFKALDALNDDFAYMISDRADSIILTGDGGRTWQETLLPCSSESPMATFIDPSIGWAYDRAWSYEDHSCINRTVNAGQMWACTEVPDNGRCPQE